VGVNPLDTPEYRRVCTFVAPRQPGASTAIID
jgi:hypothetical protein